MKVKNPVSSNIRIFPKINQKKRICKPEKFKIFKVCSFMHSILGRGSFTTHSSITEVWHGSDQPVALLRHYWAFSSSGLLDRLFLIFLLKIFHRFHRGVQVRHVGCPIKRSDIMVTWSANHLEVVLAVWASAKFLLEKEISISIKLVSRWKHLLLPNLLVDGCVDFGLDKTQWTKTSRRHGPRHTGLQAAWILCLSTLPPDSGTLISKWNEKFTFYLKRTL